MAEMKEVAINYSVSMKASLPQDKFENASVHVSRSETWAVTSEDEANLLYAERYQKLQSELGDLAVEKYLQIKKGEV